MVITKNQELLVSPMLESLIVQLLLRKQEKKCGICGNKLSEFQIHHYRYGEDITINDLSAICGDCHGKETRGYGLAPGRLRDISKYCAT
jgi:hypothetical protein